MTNPEPDAVLVVDDLEENRDMLSRRLERSGFKVLVSSNGRDALGKVAAGGVDLVLLDVTMPEMSGLEVLESIRKTSSAMELPVIMVTARTDSDDVVRALELGANDYATKPVDFPVLLARMQAQLRMRRAMSPPPPPSPPRPDNVPIGPGYVLAGKYRLAGVLGAGAFGTVYRARHLDLENEVAIKVLKPSLSADEEARERFRREGMSACRLRHENVVAILDFDANDVITYLVMEMLEGESLLDLVSLEAPLPAARSAQIMAPVCDALATAHELDIVHRDIKPSNIFLERGTRGEIPKVLDFGIARLAGELAVSGRLTLDGVVLGTPAYMAPERFRGSRFDGQSDVYSVGVTLFQMLTGSLPFEATSSDPLSLAMRVMNDPPPEVLERNPETPGPLATLVRSALAKDPERRPSARSLAHSLRQVARAVEADATSEMQTRRPGAPVRDLETPVKQASLDAKD